jgi:hypothetical protein
MLLLRKRRMARSDQKDPLESKFSSRYPRDLVREFRTFASGFPWAPPYHFGRSEEVFHILRRVSKDNAKPSFPPSLANTLDISELVMQSMAAAMMLR